MCSELAELDRDHWRLLIALELDPEILATVEGRRRVHVRVDRLLRQYLEEITTARHVA